MLLEQQEREPELEPEPEPEPVALRVPQYFFDDLLRFDDPLRFVNHIHRLQDMYGIHVDDAPHQRGRNQANFDWMREPGRCNLTLS